MADQPLIVFDGTESVNGRAFLAISALHWCVDWLPRARVRLIDVTDENVALAARAFHWDTGIALDLWKPPPSPEQAGASLAGASLYAGIAFRSAGHMRIDAARGQGIPVLLAVQFPDESWFSASTLLREDAAFDPRIFAAHLSAIITPWL